MSLVPNPLGRLAALPCGARLLDALHGNQDVWLVGGAVRDLLLGREPRELDLVTTGDVAEVAERLGGDVEQHDRFGTAKVLDGDCEYDIAHARTESYARPGALPDVAFTDDLKADLERRDFTVNAVAMSLDGTLIEYPGALADLERGVLRTLHPRSFVDDPTRIWRMVRYAVRLGFSPQDNFDPVLLNTVSGDRIGAELRLALAEPDPLATLHAVGNAGIAPIAPDAELVASALRIAPPEARTDLIALGCSLAGDEWVSGLGFPASELEVIRRCIFARPVPTGRPSEIAAQLRGLPPEAASVAGARGDASAAELWLLQLRYVDLEIDGDDLIAAGLQPGPEIGRRLAHALDAKLDGMANGRDEELAEALR